MKPRRKKAYHHGNLAESLLDAVDELATQFGLEAVTLRGCAKMAGVSPSSAFRHYSDKRDLLTAFATRAANQLSDAMDAARTRAEVDEAKPFRAVGLAYIEFALDKPAFFRAMWRQDAIYISDKDYAAATRKLAEHLQADSVDTNEGDNCESFSPREHLAWSAVHGLSSLLIDGPVARDKTRAEKLKLAADMLDAMAPAFSDEVSGLADG